MGKLSIKEIVLEVLRENIGPGPDDLLPMSQIYLDVYNNFLSPNSFPNFDPEKEFELNRYESRIKLGKNIFDKEFGSDLEEYRKWQRTIDLPKGRSPRKFSKPFDSVEKN
jgi:hypothetical protein